MKSLTLLHILIPGLLAAQTVQNPRSPQGGQMTPAQVITHVKQKDWRVVERPGIVEASAGPSLLPLLDDQDPEIRQLTVTA